MRSKTIPADAELIRTYDELREFHESFFRGEISFLLLQGRAGLGKSVEFEASCKPRKDRDGNPYTIAHYVKGNVTPVEAYKLAYENRDKLLVFDDAERLWADRNGRYLLRDLTENKPRKTVSWRTANKELASQGIPKSFETSSRVCLIMNRFDFGGAHEYDAIVDRAQFVYFDPSPLEIHKNTALWFYDQEVFDFIGNHLQAVDPNKLSSRAYVKAHERKLMGNWQQLLINSCFSQSSEEWVLALESNSKWSISQMMTGF